MNHFLAENNIKREKYLKERLFLKFFDILCNKPSRWSQKFAIEVTKLMPPDEIRRFNGIYMYAVLKILIKLFMNKKVGDPYPC
jgi:hypothetical protein